MRFLYSLLTVLFSTFAVSLFAQCPPPGFPDSGDNCGNPIICESLDGYCNTINNNNVSRPFPCCQGWTLNNDEWFGFFAGTTTITIEITPTNCNGNQPGLQGAIYAACPPSNSPGANWCNNNVMDSQCSCTEDPFTLSSTNFVVGQVYWIVFDGCGGSVCDYSVQVLAGSTQGFAPPDPGPMTGPSPICQGTSGLYQIDPVNGATIYTWTLVPSNAGTIVGNDNDISVNWAAGFSGTATLCVKTSNACYSNPNESCLTIDVLPKPTATLSGTGVLCAGAGGSVDLTVTLTGDPDWRFVYAIAGVNQPPITTSSSPYIITATQPGAYTLVSVVSTDSDPACAGTVSGTVTINEVQLNPSATTVAANCGLSTGSVDLTVGGTGMAPYTYSWSSGQTTQDLSSIPPGPYTVTVTDKNGCTATLTVTVNDNITAPTLSATTVANTTCNGGNGSIDLTVTPAANNTYLWSGGETTQDLSNLPAGTYTVTVSQGLTCTATGSYTVTDNPNLPNPTATTVGSVCNLPNGSINASVTGGVAPYTYLWSGGQTTEDLSNIDAGNYTLTVTGANGCTQSVSVTVANSDIHFTLSGVPTPNTSCNSGNGSIDLTPNPAVPPAPLNGYTYNWSDGSTVQDPSNLAPGNYTVTVSAGGSCTATASFNVADNPNRPVPTAIPTGSTCSLSNGSIDASVTGGVAPYTYLWGGGETTQDLSNIPPGNYSLTVTGANGCTQTINVNVPNTDPPITITGTTQPNTACTGGNGSIDITATPANPNYTYNWSNGATSQDLSNLPPGDYTVTVSAGGSCTRVANFTVGDNPNYPIPSATTIQSTCDLANGSIDASVTGGVPPYTYNWSNGATTQDLSMVLAGNYTITVTGANGCSRTLNVTVGNNNPPINLNATVVANTLCTGGNGSIDLSATPAGPNYTYNWSNGATSQDISGLPPGNYTVTVSAGGSCTATATYNVPDGPNLPIPTATTVQSTCDLANGSIDASVTGGVPPYTYLWSNGATTQDLSNILAGNYILTVTAANGCTRLLSVDVTNNNPPINLTSVIVANTICNGGNGSIDLTAAPAGPPYTYTWSNGATTQDLSNLTPGDYTVTVSAGGTCTATATYNVPDNPNRPIPTATTVQTTCGFANGSIDASVTGGVPPYTYAWSNGATTQDLSMIVAGNYVLTVTGANGCTQILNVDVTNNNPPINVTATTMPNTVCNASPNGSINITVTPPGPPYTFTWSNGATTEDISGLAVGSYTVTISAGGTCTQVATFDVPDNPNAPMITSTVVNTTCDFANGSINVVVNGGPTPYTYLWSNGATTQNLSMLLAGSYQITVTSANGCTVAADITVANNNPPIDLSVSILSNTTCNNNPNGSINLSVLPANPAYTYTWSNGATTQDLNNIPAGDYSVTVSAGGSCIQIGNYNVPFDPNEPQLSALVNDANCGLPNGSINLSVSGGVPPYTYAWSSGQTVQDLNAITGGDYFVVVTGANGCTAVEQIVVNNNDIPIDIDANVTGKTSCIINNGMISLTVTPFNANILWSNGSTSKNLTGLSTGDYTVTVSMGGTCTASVTYTIDDETEKPVITADIMPAVCSFNNGSVDLTVEFGIEPYTYDWAHLPGTSNMEDLFNLSAGNYVVTVTTAVGCTEVFFAPIDNELLQVELTGVVDDDYSCTSNNGFIDINVDPVVNYTFDWAHIPGTNNPQNLINLGAGTYTVTATFGTCKASATFDVIDATEPPSISISPSAATCGQSNGMVTLNVSGATPPYNFDWAHIPGTNNAQNLNNLAPGTYTVTVTDFYDCTATATTVVANNTIALNISSVPTANTSCALPNGSLDISVLPAGNNYNYIWSNAATTQDLMGLAPGIYSVTVSLGTGCTSQATSIVGNNTVDPTLSPVVTAAICSQSNGDIQVTTASGTAPYNFLWSNAATTEDLNNIFPGNYSLTVTDANGCTADTTLNVANNASTFSLSASASPYSNCATINGAIDLTVTPVGPYTYLWSTGETTQDLNGIPAGTYTVEVTEQGTCIASATYFVLDTRTSPTLNQNINPELCNLLDGNVDISILSGGIAPFNYIWETGQTTEDLSNIGGGTYTITVTGANNCSASLTAIVPENDISFSLTATTVPNSSCVVLNGSVDLEITPAVPGGGPGYTYTWSGGYTTQDLNPVPAGTYAVTVSAGGTCTNTASYMVPDAAGAPSISAGVSQALCGQSSGGINLTINSGAAPYSFSWSNGTMTEDLTNIPSGNYAVTVTGANGCQISNNFDVPENVVIPNLAGIPQPNTACVGPNGSINLGISPSTLMYTINWSNGATTQNLSNLTAGTYTVVVNGGGACTASASYTVDNSTALVTAGGTKLDILCFGDNTGAIDLMLTGGTQPFVFAWTPFLNGVEDPSGISAGNYIVTVTDAVGCTTTASFTIDQPASPVQITCTALNTVSQPGFTDGNAQLQISGGVAPYTVLWSPGGTQSGVAAGIFPLSNLGVGNYNVTVTDANGCTEICNFSILLTPCTSAVGTMGSTQLTRCNVGCITANYDGLGQLLDPNDVLQFILHEGPGTTIVNEKARSSQPTFCFNPAKMTYGTTYYISAVVGNNDGSGNVVLAHYCTVVATGTPIVFYEKPVASIVVPEPITCAKLQVTLTGSSNLPNATFQWSTLTGNLVGPSNQAIVEANSAGTYNLIINSANGCLDTATTVVLDIRNDPVAKILASPDDLLDCIIDEIVLAGEIKGSSDANTIWYDQNGVVYAGGTVIQIVDPGTYWFAIVDTVTFCTDTASIIINQDQLYPPLFINPPAILNCSIGSVTISGGSPIGGIQFQWGIVNGQDTTIIGNGTSIVATQATTYILYGYDPVNGCNNSLSTVVLADQSYPTADAGPPFNIDCFGQTLPINASASGGTGTLNYIWTTSGGVIVSGSNSLSPLISEPGTYKLVVTSTGNGCTDTDEVIVSPNEPRALATINSPACLGERGSILIDTVLGAKPPLQYTITPGPALQSGGLFSNLTPGSYTIFIEDANGCETSVDATVIQPDEFVVTIDPQVTLQLGESYLAEATVNIPESEIASIQWTPPTWLSCDTCLTTRIDTPLHTQLYRILVVTKEGCRDDAPLLLRVNRQVKVYIPNIFSPNNDNNNDYVTVFADLKGVRQVKLFQIFDRWGDEVFVRENFQPNDPTLGWDGRFRGQDMNPAVFVYYAIVEFIDGQEVLFKGDITLER